MKQLFKDTVKVSIEDIVPDPNNPNKMTKEQAKSLIYSMKKFDDVMPIVVDSKSMIVADGHHRLEAYKTMGVKEIEVIKKDFKNATERILFGQTMNKLRGEHDKKLDVDVVYALVNGSEENLLEYMRLLAIEDENLVYTYIAEDRQQDDRDLAQSIKAVQNYPRQTTEADELHIDPDSITDPITEKGDLWKLGDHRLVCGDLSDPIDLKRLLGSKKVDCVFVDPPYNIMGSSNGMTRMDDDNVIQPFFVSLLKAIRLNLKVNGHAYICCNWRTFYPLNKANENVGLSQKNLIVWHKPNARLGSLYSSSHEFIWFLANDPVKKNLKPSPSAEGKTRLVLGETNVWVYNNETVASRGHFAQKPVVIVERAINNSTDKGQTVLDLCMGSGTTFIAAEKSGRVAYGLEIDPRYCDVIVKRWEEFTGQKAEVVKE